jgi:Flp pilus assembly protein TadB
VALIGMLLGALIGLGILELARGGRPLPRLRLRRRLPATVLLGIGAGLGLFLLTGWPVLGVAGGFLAAQVLQGARETRQLRQTLARRGELAWVAARLRDACLAGHGLPAAVGIVAAEAGPGIKQDMIALAKAVREVGVGRAFATYAQRAPDPIFGLFARVVGEADRQGSDALSSLLTRLASQTSKEVAAARETEARQERATALVVASFAIGLLVAMRFGSPTYTAAYGDPLGQLVMAGAFIPIGLGYWAMVRSRHRAGQMLSWAAR